MSRGQQLGLFLTVFFGYLVLGSRELPWNDAKRIYEVAESLARRGALDIPPTTAPAIQRNGKYFAVNPFVTSAIHVPGAFVDLAVEKVSGHHKQAVRALASHLGPAALAALLALLFALLCRDLEVSQLATNISVVLLTIGTMVAVYARSSLSEISQVTTFLGFYLWLLRLVRNPTPRAALWMGVWLGLLANTKVIYVLVIPGAAIFASWQLLLRHEPKRVLSSLGWTMLGALPGLLVMLVYNHLRTGSITNTGYGIPSPTGAGGYGENPLVGLLGLFFSPGKSVFLYSPPLIFSLLALPRALTTHDRRWLWAFLFISFPVIYVTATLQYWGGDWCWGPRYLLFLVPVMLLPLAFLLDDLTTRRRRRPWAFALAAGALALGLLVQTAGALSYWDTYIRISQTVRTQWLGSPNRGGSNPPDVGGSCNVCIEDLYALNWVPPMTPILGHLWLVPHTWRGDSWVQAEADGPWHRYTKLNFNIADAYGRARVDWWFLDWRGPMSVAGNILLALFLFGWGLSVFGWWWASRSRPT